MNFLENNTATAWLNHDCDTCWDLYSRGFLTASFYVLEKYKEDVDKQPVNADEICYPVVFLFRHYIELRTKSILNKYYSTNERKRKEFHEALEKCGHNLKTLWEEYLKEIYKKQYPDKKDFQEQEKIILFIHDIDESSFNFRYPMDKKGNKSLPINRFSYPDFEKKMIFLSESLECLFNRFYILDENDDVSEE